MTKAELDALVAGPFIRRSPTTIDCVYKMGNEELQFTAWTEDPEPYGRAIYAAIMTYYAGQVQES